MALFGTNSYNDIGLLVPRGSNLKSPKDLAGKKIIFTAGSLEAPFLDTFLKAGGLKREQVELLSVEAAAKVPGVDLVVVVDDGSADATSRIARECGAVVVRHARCARTRAKHAAAETHGRGVVVGLGRQPAATERRLPGAECIRAGIGRRAQTARDVVAARRRLRHGFGVGAGL